MYNYTISKQIRRKHTDRFNRMSDKELTVISLKKRKGIATQMALLAQEILWKRNGSSDNSWKDNLWFKKLCSEESED